MQSLLKQLGSQQFVCNPFIILAWAVASSLEYLNFNRAAADLFTMVIVLFEREHFELLEKYVTDRPQSWWEEEIKMMYESPEETLNRRREEHRRNEDAQAEEAKKAEEEDEEDDGPSTQELCYAVYEETLNEVL